MQVKVRTAYIGSLADASDAKGLVADFDVYENGKYRPVVGQVLEKDPGDGQFGYNACRYHIT